MNFRFILTAIIILKLCATVFAQDTIYLVNNTKKIVHLTRKDSSYYYYIYNVNSLDEFRLKFTNIVKINFSEKNKALFYTSNHLKISDKIRISDSIQLANVNSMRFENQFMLKKDTISNNSDFDLLDVLFSTSSYGCNRTRSSLFDLLFLLK